MNVAKIWATDKMVAEKRVSVRPGPSTPTPRTPLGDSRGDMRKHTLVKIVKSEHSKGKHPSWQCRVCAVHKKRSMSTFASSV
jgi:hypothetical protein